MHEPECMSMCACVICDLKVGDGTQANSFKEQRIKGWRHLCAGELLVWIGIAIKMGTLGRCRAAHYWSNRKGFGDDSIKDSMKKNRWKQIASNLTFAPRGTSGGWDKIKWLDDFLREMCRLACGITQNCAVDESMFTQANTAKPA